MARWWALTLQSAQVGQNHAKVESSVRISSPQRAVISVPSGHPPGGLASPIACRRPSPGDQLNGCGRYLVSPGHGSNAGTALTSEVDCVGELPKEM